MSAVPRPHALLVVGDRFVSPRMPPGVVGVSQFASYLKEGRYDDPQGEYRVHLGQGVGSYEESFLREELERSGLSKYFAIEDAALPKVSRSYVHKHRQENVLIAGLETTGPNQFQAKLRVDGDNELLLDHTTGWHIPGMVILEAMRQLSLAVAEKFYPSSSGTNCRSFVIHNWNTTFENFLFPTDSVLTCNIEVLNASRRNRLALRAELSVMQGDQRTAQASIEFTGFDQHAIGAIEERRANEIVKELVLTEPEPEANDLAEAV